MNSNMLNPCYIIRKEINLETTSQHKTTAIPILEIRVESNIFYLHLI